ncbi:MAG: hypothetical protein AB4040_04990 [Synechococcus sp.]
MVYQFSCPHCGSPLFFADRKESDEDFQEGLCRCRLLFALQQLDVVTLEVNDDSNLESPQPRRRQSHYQLKALDARGKRVALQFSGVPIARCPAGGRKVFDFKRWAQFLIPSKLFSGHLALANPALTNDAGLPNGYAAHASLVNVTSSHAALMEWPEDRLLLLYAVSRGQLQMLTQVRPAGGTANASQYGVEVASLRWHLWQQRIRAGGLAVAMGLSVALPLQDWRNPFHWLVTGVATIAAVMLAGRGARYRLRDRDLLRRLDTEQLLLQQQYYMEQKQSIFRRRLQEQRRLLRRLVSLKRRMQQADGELYAKRIGVLTRGIYTVKESTVLTKNLRDGYGQLVKMLAIEYETSRLAEQLPVNSTQEIFQRVGELEAMEERRQQLEVMVNPQQLLKAI